MKKRSFGLNKKGEETTLYTFENTNGMVMEVTDFGATLYALEVPAKDGKKYDVVLGYDSPVEYEDSDGTFFGATVGRNGNRIGQAKFILNGKEYQLDVNNGPNNLHSGLDFYSFRNWNVKNITDNSITFSLHSPDGDQGYPGALDVDVTYTLTADNEVKIDYYAVPDADTIVNMTNHSYFNLNGHDSGNILTHDVWIDADTITRVDADLIPTGELVSVEGTPMDFRTRKMIGKEIDNDYEALNYGKGYDHNWCLNNNGEFAKVAELYGDKTGMVMEVYTDLPGVQMYAGNFLKEQKGKKAAVYNHRQGVCFETQNYPDAINHENFPNPVFKKGQIYKTTTVYKFL